MTRRIIALFWACGLVCGAARAQEGVQPAPPAYAEIDLGWTVPSLAGSSLRAGHYVRPYSGPLFSIRRLDLRTSTGFDAVDLWANDLGGDRSDLTAAIWSPGLPGMLRLDWERSVFWSDPTALNPGLASRSDFIFNGRIRPVGSLVVRGFYGGDSINRPSIPRITRIQYDVERYGAGLDIPLGRGVLGLDYRGTLYRDRGPLAINSSTFEYGVHYSHTLTNRWVIGGAARWATIQQAGLPDSELFVATAANLWQPARNLATDLRFRYRDIDLGPTANAYVSESLSGSLGVTYRPSRKVKLKVGAERSEYDRLNAVQSAVEHPQQWRYWARADYRAGGNLRASASYQRRTIAGLRASAAPAMFDARSLLFSEEDKLDLRASSMVGAGGLAYGSYQYLDRSLALRNSNHRLHSLGGGVLYPLTSRLNLAADVFYRQFDTNLGVLNRADSDVLTAHLGIGWVISRDWSMTADYHRVESYFGEDADSNYLTASISGPVGPGILSIGLNRHDYENALLPALDFEVDLLDLRYQLTF